MRLQQTNERRGVILMVVLSLLTLFAIVGLTFVLYADAEATSARIAREGESLQHADMEPEEALALFLGQLIYDVPDTTMTGVGSGLRGHSLARTMYGYNYSTNINVTPYNGVGRLHSPSLLPYVTSIPTQFNYNSTNFVDDYALVNYTWFSADTLLVGQVRDPERYGLRASPAIAQTNPYVGGNVSYTYPDLNNFFLAAVTSNGTVLSPSFHRKWLFNPSNNFNDMTNLNWTNLQGKYLTPRPRPIDHPGFPAPDDAWGDVKNLVGAPGGNDSIWIDIGAPVMTAPDGTKYKALFAPLIMDLDNRINVAAAGNVAGTIAGVPNSSVSNQGWFPTEVNLSQVLNYATPPVPPATTPTTIEWQNLFRGNGTYYGKYGVGQQPSAAPVLSLPIGVPGAATGTYAHVYSQVDLDGRNELAGANTATPPIQLPGSPLVPPNTVANPATSCFPSFPYGYGCGSTAEWTNHPAAYSVYKSPLSTANTNLVFRPSDMEALLRPNSLGQTAVDTGSSALISQLLRLCPYNLSLDPSIQVVLGTNQPLPYQRRNWITTISSDLARPGLSPWIYNPAIAPNPAILGSSAYLVNATQPTLPPVGMSPAGTPNPFVSFPALTQLNQTPLPPGSDFALPNDWRSLSAALGRIDLNRWLPDYPHMLPVTNPVNPNAVPTNNRFDSSATAMTQFTAASLARQTLANDIYRRLLAVTGVAPSLTPLTPNPNTELPQRRWLAQLAVNIVDYIDADEISTPFNFYNTLDGLAATNIYQVTPATGTNSAYAYTATTSELPMYWVFGTELPRVVISEALGEYTLPTDGASPPNATQGTFNVNLWVELFNPMPTIATVTGYQTNNASVLQPQDSQPVPLYMPGLPAGTPSSLNPGFYSPYQLTIANNNMTANSNGLWLDQNVAPLGPGLNNNVLGTPQQARYYIDPSGNLPTLPAGTTFTEGSGLAWTAAAPFWVNQTPTYPLSSVNLIDNPPWGLAGGSPLPVAAQPSFMLVGPSNPDVNNDISVAAGVPGTTPFQQSVYMAYQVNFNPTNPTASQWSAVTTATPATTTATATFVPILDNTTGVSVLLRRLANPHLPANPFLATGALTNATLPPNPYVTVDYVNGVPLNGYGMSSGKPVLVSQFNKPIPANNSPLPTATMPVGPGPTSYGKLQPYAAHFSQYSAQTTGMTGTNNANITNHHTLGSANLPFTAPFTWLTHLDRKLISPMELLHVSGFHPHELTQRFVLLPNANSVAISQPYGNPTSTLPNTTQYLSASGGVLGSYYFQHYVPWFDQSRRLFRIFEFLETHNGMSGISTVNGRVPGKININTLWDNPLTTPQIYQALYDSTGTFSNTSNFSTTAVNTLLQTLLNRRTPNLATGALSATDQPLVGMAAGVAPVPPTDPQYPNGMGINHTLFMDNQLDVNASPINDRVLQMPNVTSNNPQSAHPYMQMELLNKIYNRLTTRSNVFAVFVTVGFFQVANPAANPPTLGAEIGLSEGRNVRHRMFAIVDRTNLQAGSALWSASIAGITAANPSGNQTITVPNLTLTNANTGTSAMIVAASQLVFEPGTANEETVTVQAVNTPPGTAPNTVGGGVAVPNITANFTLAHLTSTATAVTGNTSGTYTVAIRGNPGPWLLPQQPYDPRKDSGVVLYYNIID